MHPARHLSACNDLVRLLAAVLEQLALARRDARDRLTPDEADAIADVQHALERAVDVLGSRQP